MRIVHLSDLHFEASTSPDLIVAAVEAINTSRPDVIVCTGDIVSRAHRDVMEAVYVTAQAFRDALDCKVFLSVPGNHDFYDEDYADIDLYTRLWEPEPAFFHNGAGALIVGVNSGIQTDEKDTQAIPDPRTRKAFETAAAYIKRGDVETEQVQLIQEAVQEADLDDVRILALHHHLLPIFNTVYRTSYNFDMVTNAADILEALRQHRFDIVLNGHKHVPQLNILNGTLHLTGGSLFLPLPAGQENSFNIVDIDDLIQLQVCSIPSGRVKTLWCGPNPKFFKRG